MSTFWSNVCNINVELKLKYNYNLCFHDAHNNRNHLVSVSHPLLLNLNVEA